MHINTLAYVANQLIRYGISAQQITIKGKDSMTLSFTAPRREYEAIARLCEDSGYTFHTSADEFIARSLDRYQIHLGEETF